MKIGVPSLDVRGQKVVQLRRVFDGRRPSPNDDKGQQARAFLVRYKGARGSLEALQQPIADVASISQLPEEEHIVFLRVADEGGGGG